MQTKLILLSLVCLFSLTAKAGGDDKLAKRDSLYITIPDRPWSFRAYTVNKVLQWELKTKTDSVPSVRYNPNNKPGFGVGVFHRSFGAWIGLRLDALNGKDEQVQLDLQLNQYGEQFYTDLYLQLYKGFRLDNTYAHVRPGDPLPSEDIRRADLSFYSAGLNLNYLLNWKKFSMRAAFIQSEMQKKSAGSFFLGMGLNAFGFNGDSSVVPNATTYHPVDAVRSGTYFSTTLNLGYSHTFVWWKNWYANATLGVGVGLMSWNYKIEQKDNESGFRPMFRTLGRLSGGYNSRRWFAGFSLILDTSNLNYRGNHIDYQLGNSRVFVGFRPNF